MYATKIFRGHRGHLRAIRGFSGGISGDSPHFLLGTKKRRSIDPLYTNSIILIKYVSTNKRNKDTKRLGFHFHLFHKLITQVATFHLCLNALLSPSFLIFTTVKLYSTIITNKITLKV